MTGQFVGEIKMFAGNFAPVNYATCQGQLMAIQQNTALFSILGTTYGGNGTSTFALPDMQGRMPVGQGNGLGLSPRVLGEEAGIENTTILISNLPQHAHSVTLLPGASSAAGTSGTPGPGLVPAASTARDRMYGSPADTTLQGTTVSSSLTGQGIPISTQSPFLCVTFIIALFGIFPARN